MAEQTITLNFSIKEIFTLIPEIAENIIRVNPIAARLADSFQGKEFGFSCVIDDSTYSLLIKNGREFISGNGNLEKPHLTMAMSMGDLEKLIKVKNARLFIGKNINPAKLGGAEKPAQIYDRFVNLKGTVVTELKDGSGETSRITFVLNGSDSPKTTIRLTMDHLAGLVAKKENAVNLFMSGQLQIDGDMGLAMNIQTLF
jgi:hypothetical protein